MRTPTLLLVEDEDEIRFAVSDYLEQCGFCVVEAESAAAALKALAADPTITAVLTDVRMPGEMNGLALAEWIFNNRPGMPIFVASGDYTMATTAERLCGGKFFRKPYNLGAVAEDIRAAISQHR